MSEALQLLTSVVAIFAALDAISDGAMATTRGRLTITLWVWLAAVSCMRFAIAAGGA